MQSLYDSATVGLTGAVDYVHTHVDFGDISLTVDGKQVYTPVYIQEFSMMP